VIAPFSAIAAEHSAVEVSMRISRCMLTEECFEY
jgi:hypothetical protein